jgi:hypothetical protein
VVVDRNPASNSDHQGAMGRHRQPQIVQRLKIGTAGVGLVLYQIQSGESPRSKVKYLAHLLRFQQFFCCINQILHVNWFS